MIAQELRQLQEALNRKADAVQREFNAIGEKLQGLSQKVRGASDADRELLVAEQAALREKQQTLAGEINQWRDRAQSGARHQGDVMLQAYLDELLATQDESIRPAVERVRYLLNASEEELAGLAQTQAQARPTTPVGRLLERARTELDLRSDDPAPRQKAAFEFANRAGMAQNDEALAELLAALEDKDPRVQEVATLGLIQMYRFRVRHLSDLDAVHSCVERLTHLKHRAVIPVLIEILETPRTGFTSGAGGMIEGNNNRSRAAALNCLVEWHTSQAQAAVQARRRDRDPQIAEEAARLLEAYPGEWK